MLPPLGTRKGVLSSGLAVFIGILLAAQSPMASAGEYPIGGALPGDQDFPSVSVSANGGYLVWQDNRIEGAKHGSSIAALGLDASLTATGSVLRINQQALGNQEKPHVLLLNAGKALFAWETRHGSKPGVFARLLDPSGRFLTGDILVNTPTLKQTIKQTTNWTAHYRNVWKSRKYKFRDTIINVRELAGGVALAALPDGGAVVAYHAGRKSETNTWTLTDRVYLSRGRFVTNAMLTRVLMVGDWMQDVYFQRLDSAGEKVGPEVQVNQYETYNQRNPAVGVLSDGRFVVVWVSEFPVSADWRRNFRVGLFGRIFDAQGNPAGDEFPIAASEDLIEANPAVAALPAGGFTVYSSRQENSDSRRWDVYGRNFGADGVATGPAFRVNQHTAGDQFGPRVAVSGDQQFVVWTSVGQDGSREGVFGRLIIGGGFGGDELGVNSTTASRQHHPAVSTDGQGRFLAVWAGFAGETGFDVFGQNYSVGTGPTEAPGQ